MLSHIDKIKGFEHVYKLVSYFTTYQFILSWNLIWACIHNLFVESLNWYKKINTQKFFIEKLR